MFFTPALNKANKVASVPAPIGGLNARDSIVAMPETDALVMQNWWPQPYGCSVRKGSNKWSTGLPSPAHSMATWASSTGTQKLSAWAGTAMYDVSIPGVVAAPEITGLTNDIWEFVMVSNAAGNSSIALNGFDDAIKYSLPAGLVRIVAGDGIVANTWAGIDPRNAVCPTLHQHRLWVVEKNSTAAWFLPPDAIQGTFLKYDFGPLFPRGGFLQFLCTWTLDDGAGATDHLVAVSSRGDAVVYAGTDPEDDLKWGLRGVYFIGAPVAGRRCFTKAGGDVYILTQQGIVSMSGALTSTKVEQAQDKIVSDKIKFLLSTLISNYSNLFGWDLKYFPKHNMLIVNVPSSAVDGNVQLACNQITGAWTEFRAWDANCWVSFGSSPLFADNDNNIMLAWVGNKDKANIDGSGGTTIVSSVQQAYSYAGAQVNQKQVGLYRPTFITGGTITFASNIQYDFTIDPLTIPDPAPTPPITFGTVWGTALWGTSTWGVGGGGGGTGGGVVQRQWIQANGMGVAASLRMVSQTETDVLWVSTDYSFIVGDGIL